MYIYVDDIRSPVERPRDLVICRNYVEAITIIDQCMLDGIAFIIDLDHDLGEEKTGYDIAKYIVENQYKDCTFKVHSSNPVGRVNIRQLVTHYGYEYFD
ncbi:MAG: hypothetical protein MJZ34_07400 [Paludibacteraceae bacterium]|nr:hypothetical protein [Paludibacteraceae bacterium]